jgi:hypothetical protein
LTDNGIQLAEQLRNRNTIYSRQMRFDMICEANDIEHWLTEPNHLWTNGQVKRMNRTIKDRPRQAIPLRRPCPAAHPPRRLSGGLQLRAKAQDAEWFHALPTHLQNLDVRAGAVHPGPNPPDARTEHLVQQQCLLELIVEDRRLIWSRGTNKIASGKYRAVH